MGLAGPDGGKGGKYLLLPPGFAGNVPAGYHIGRSPTYKAMLAVRAIPQQNSEGGADWAGALQSLRQVKVYPLSDPRGVLPHFDFSNRAVDMTPLRWERNLEFWRRLHGIIESEPPSEESRLMYGELQALGIERGRPFAPDERMRHVLEAAAHTALEEMRAEGFASERPDRLVWKDRQWEWASLVTDDPNFETRDFIDLQARDRWFIQAVVASPAMFRRRTGSGSIYFEVIRDGEGAYLDGGQSYKLTVPQPVPAKLFWSVTAYDIETRSQVQTAQDKAVLTSLRDTFTPGPDGSVELYFGPEPPSGPAARRPHWIQTAPERGFFLYFRDLRPRDRRLRRLLASRRHDAGRGARPDAPGGRGRGVAVNLDARGRADRHARRRAVVSARRADRGDGRRGLRPARPPARVRRLPERPAGRLPDRGAPRDSSRPASTTTTSSSSRG